MGDFRIVINAAGGHGCDRAARSGEPLMIPPHGAPDFHERHCPDCQAYAFVQQLAATMPVMSATFTHWPGQPEEVVDDITTTRPYRKSGQIPRGSLTMTKAKNVWRVSCVMTDLLTRAPRAMTASNLKGILLAAAENHSGLAVSKLSARLIGTRQPRHRRAKQRKKR